MEYSLKNKVVIVTGGANGIGYEIVDKYLEEGAKIAIILDIDEMRGNEAVKKITSKYGVGKAEFIKCDVTRDLESVSKNILDKYNTVDVLVLNAGMSGAADPKYFVDILLTSVMEWSIKFSEYMTKDKTGNGGTILVTSSILGVRVVHFASVYQAAKFGVTAFVKSFGHERNFQKNGIRVLAICPGFTETNMAIPLRDPKLRKTMPDQELLKYSETRPWQKVEEVGKAAIEIFKKAKSGSVWVIEGGNLTEVV